MTSQKSLDALKIEIRERVAVRLSSGSRWTLAEALRRRARRRMQQSLLSLLVLGGGMALTLAAAAMMGAI